MNCPTYARSSSAQTAVALRRPGADVQTKRLIWQNPLPAAPDTTRAEADPAAPREQTAASEPTGAQQLPTGWMAAATFRRRRSAKRGGANGARIRHQPERSGEVNLHMHAGMP
jgi:catalase-peroxidase